MKQIHETARIIGNSLTEGNTRIGPGAVIENSYLKDVVVDPGAKITDSVLITSGSPKSHKCDAAGKWIARGAGVAVGEGTEIVNSVLKNTSVGPKSQCTRCALEESMIGAENKLRDMKGVLIHTEPKVTVRGPTEISEAWLGHHAFIDTCGYFEGVFSNEFHVIEFDKTSGQLNVVDTINLPHLSRYGMNTICSTNSGKAITPPEGKLKSIGPYVEPWHESTLSLEPVMMGPCCWVSGWTKIIGLSARPYSSSRELLEDNSATYVMPISVAGLEGNSVQGQVTSGELNSGYSYKKRMPGGVFTYASTAVIDMIRRLAERVPEGGLDMDIVDRIAVLTLKNALAMTCFSGFQRGYDLNKIASKKSKGWKGWCKASRDVLEAHLNSGLWEFKDGEPLQWKREKDKWIPKDASRLLSIAPDALERQYTEEDILKCAEPALEHTLGVTTGELELTKSKTAISKEASVSEDTFIGPGVQITGNSIVESGAWVYGSVVHNTQVGCNVRLLRCVVKESRLAKDSEAISSFITNSSVGENSTATSARIQNSSLGARSIINSFADLRSVTARKPVILAGRMVDSEIETVLMFMHMAGEVSGMKAIPVSVEIDGEKNEIFPVPMIGGGARLQGTKHNSVFLEPSFLGSNAILEAGSYVGFGSFVLGKLGGDEGLPPFTISLGAGPGRDIIGGVLTRFASIVITHFIEWTFQANGPQKVELTAGLINSMIREGRAAVRWAIEQRKKEDKFDLTAPYARFKSLARYTDAQLDEGLWAYDKSLSDSRWNLEYTDEELRFSGQGAWEIANGAARWVAQELP